MAVARRQPWLLVAISACLLALSTLVWLSFSSIAGEGASKPSNDVLVSAADMFRPFPAARQDHVPNMSLRALTRHDRAHFAEGIQARSEHNYENSRREPCNFDLHKLGFVHAAAAFATWGEWVGDQAFCTEQAHAWQEFVDNVPAYQDVQDPATLHKRGIVLAAGPNRYFNVLVTTLRMLRATGCRLPVEVWHFAGELNTFQLNMVKELNATPRDIGSAEVVAVEFDDNDHKRFTIKPAAMMNSAFEEILWLDADTVPVRDPSYLFDTPQFQQTGMVAWADFWTTDSRSPLYCIFNLTCYREREFETGQFMVNKRIHWRALNLAWWMNRHHTLYFKLFHGDKESFRFAWKALGAPYHLVEWAPSVVGFLAEPGQQLCGHTQGHHDPDGNILFLHGNMLKWAEWKGDYWNSIWQEGVNGFSTFRLWTHVQAPKNSTLDFSFRVAWARVQPSWLCLQYKLMRPGDEENSVAPVYGDPTEPDDSLLPPLPLSELMSDYQQFYKLFYSVDGPMLATKTY